MPKLTPNISRHEMCCKCGCGFDTCDFELVTNLQKCVNHFSQGTGIIRLDITSPNRCREHNEKVQREHVSNYAPYSSKSQHMYGRAADFKLFFRTSGKQVDPEKVAQYLEETYPDKHGIGRYDNRTHYDTRSGNAARWGFI